MFTFFHKTPEVNVDAFTYSASVFEYTPLVRAISAVPDFWKNLPAATIETSKDEQGDLRVERTSNLKNCAGFIDLYRTGFILENWSAITVSVGEDGYRYYYADLEQPSFHPLEQLGEGFKGYRHIKLISPWLMKEDTGIKFHFGPAAWSHEKFDFVIVPGVADFKMNRVTHVNMLLRPKPEEYSFTIEFGEPLVHLVPLTEKRVTLKTHLIDKEEYIKLEKKTNNSFLGWRRIKKLMDRNEQRSECPFK
jgi:hypothetical protein